MGWASTDEAYSASEDHQVVAWNLVNNESTQVLKLAEDAFPTDLHWIPRGVGAGAKKVDPSSAVFALAAADGFLLLQLISSYSYDFHFSPI